MKNKSKKKKILKVLLIILAVIIVILLLFFIMSSINKHKMKKNDERLLNSIKNIESEKISYIFLEINPRFVISIKNNIVNDIACLNDDCIQIIDKINITGKKIKEGIEIVYNTTKNNGFDVSNGVTLKWNGNLDLELNELDYIKEEIIDSEEQNKLLDNVLNNDDIKNKKEMEDYNIKLWNEYKKDTDYGKIYECSIIDKELECHIKKDLVVRSDYDEDNITSMLMTFRKFVPTLEGLARVFEKFGIRVDSYTELGIFTDPFRYIYIQGTKFFVLASGDGNTAESIRFEGKKDCDYYTFNMGDLNLLKPNDLKLRYVNDDFIHAGEITDTEIRSVCGNKHCKIEGYRSKSYCNQETGVIDSDGRKIYKLCDDNKNNCQEISKEEYEDFNTSLDVYMKNVQVCQFDDNDILEDAGKIYKKLKRPSNGKYCRYKNNQILYYYEDRNNDTYHLVD